MKACVDIGGTKIAVSLAEDGARQDGRPGPLLGRVSEATAKTGENTAVAQQILRMIDAVCASQGIASDRIDRVGVSSTGPFVRRDGAIELATPNICGGLAGAAHRLPNDWTTAPIEAPLAARFRKVRVENDAVGALEAERRWGALQGIDDCAYVTWSTGIGTGVCVDGRVLRGKNGNAGHAGHSFVVSDERDALCGCGNVGDIEGLASGTAIERRFGRPANELLSAADASDADALAQVDGLCGMVGRLLYNLIVTLDLERISLGGSVFLNHQALLLPRLRAQIDGRLPALTAGVSLHAAGLGDRVGDYAALALFD
ncbi:MAG: ROK family protein [Comamonadaceae bacterium]|nr:MAG: ROK family protein [Comamonadaceae bacterium]